MQIRQFSFLLLALLFLASVHSAALGLKYPNDCETVKEIVNGREQFVPMSGQQKIYCFHEVAITMAYLGDKSEAMENCGKSYSIGQSIGGAAKDIGETQRNLCLYDIAKILKDASICEGITQSSTLAFLQGAGTTKNVCTTKVGILNTPVNYSDSLCTIVFAFPLLFALLTVSKKKKN